MTSLHARLRSLGSNVSVEVSHSQGPYELTIVDNYRSTAWLLQRTLATIALWLDELLEPGFFDGEDLCGRVCPEVRRANHGHVDS